MTWIRKNADGAIRHEGAKTQRNTKKKEEAMKEDLHSQ
jgi:hypothetical protein